MERSGCNIGAALPVGLSATPAAMRRLVLLAALAAASASAQTVSWDAFTSGFALADSAGAAYQSGRHALAGPLFRDAAATVSGTDRASALYNAACSFALAGEPDLAMAALGDAVGAGWAMADHMESDTDLASLRADARLRTDWRSLVVRTLANAEAAPAGRGAVRIVTEDVPRFWAAYDAALPALTARDTTAAAAILTRLYLDPGTDGLKGYVRLKIGGPRELAAELMPYPAYYASIRATTLRLPAAEPAIRAGMDRMTAIYPEVTFPDVYLLIGALTSGGTSTGTGLLLGAEMNTAAPDSPLGELSPGTQGIIGQADQLPHVVLHELVHANQTMTGPWTVLRNVLIEGGADFLADLAMPGRTEAHYTAWGRAHDRAVWTRFMAEKDATDYRQWTGNATFRADDWTGDLGYYVGAEVCRGYYKQAADKAQAVRDLLAMRDPDAILAASGYAARYPR